MDYIFFANFIKSTSHSMVVDYSKSYSRGKYWKFIKSEVNCIKIKKNNIHFEAVLEPYESPLGGVDTPVEDEVLLFVGNLS